MKKRVTLNDIAKEAGVSKMAVSLALRDDPSIGKETVRTICRIAEEMGYAPNRIAKGLANGRTYTIAALVGGQFHDDYHNQVLSGAMEYAMSRGYTLATGFSNSDPKTEAQLVEKFDSMMVDGYLGFPCGSSDTYKKIYQSGTPLVMYTKYFSDLDCDYVVCDDIKGGRDMTRHLIRQGHERIAFVFDSALEFSSEVVNRIAGYREALEAHGIAFDSKLVIPYDYGFDPEKTIADNPGLVKLLRSDDAPTAAFVCNDIMASLFYIFLKHIGCRIPQDISVCGYEGVYLGKILDPPLTTVSTPIRRIGETACKLLMDKIEGVAEKEEVSQISLEPTLAIRGSVVKCK